jgi:precorrin-6A/cobalt-precorrin-6A reductase
MTRCAATASPTAIFACFGMPAFTAGKRQPELESGNTGVFRTRPPMKAAMSGIEQLLNLPQELGRRPRAKTETILILGGTKEAVALAAELVVAYPDWRVITSLAGRTKEPKPVAGEVRIGGFGGAEGLAEYLTRENITRLIDATHPFARQISANAKRAAALSNTPLEVRTRPPWQKQPGDNWLEFTSLEQARDALPPAARVLLALGSQHIAPFATRADVHYVVRMVDVPDQPLTLPDHELVIGLPGDVEAEMALLRRHGITHIVCRNSGGGGAYAKIAAARGILVRVLMITLLPKSKQIEL